MRLLLIAENNEIINLINGFIAKRHPEYTVESECIGSANELTKNDSFDAVFLDDSLGENLIPTAVFIHKHHHESRLIIISDNIGLLSDLFLNITPFGVIEKPLNSERIYRYLDALKMSDKAGNKFSYMEKGRKRSVSFSNIVYVESNREKLIVRTTKSTFTLWMKISEAEPQFPDYFVRCHNSYLVNMKYVADCRKNTFRLTNGQEIVISRSRKDNTMEKFFAFKDAMR